MIMRLIFVVFLLFLVVLFLLLLLNGLLLMVVCYVLFFEISFEIAFYIFALKRLNCILLSIDVVVVVVIWACNSYSLHGQLI